MKETAWTEERLNCDAESISTQVILDNHNDSTEVYPNLTYSIITMGIYLQIRSTLNSFKEAMSEQIGLSSEPRQKNPQE